MMAQAEPHLENAARALQAILSARDPDHSYTVTVRDPDEAEAPHEQEGED